MEDWTVEIAKDMFGESLYQQRARAALPLLIRQALARQKITYANLADELGMPNPRNLNFVLGSIGTTLVELSKRWQEDVPPIQCIVINQQTGLPGAGVDPMINVSNIGKLDPRQKEAIIDSILSRVFAYTKWPSVLAELGLSEASLPDLDILRNAGRSGGAGESEFHKSLKEYVALHPECIGLSNGLSPGQMEFLLPSGDVLDILFQSVQKRIGVEIKSRISDEADILRGLFQCVKYLAILRAWRTFEGASYEVAVILAIDGSLPKSLISIRNLFGVHVVEGVCANQNG